MSSVRTPGAGTAASLTRSPVVAFPAIHQIVLPTPWSVGPVQVYAIEGDPLTLVDTGVKTDESRSALAAGLDALGYGLEDVGRVILTHCHSDHLGQAQTLRELGSGVEVWAHEFEAPSIECYSVERDERIHPTNALFREYGVDEELLARQTEAAERWMREAPVMCEATRVDRLLRDGEQLPFKDFELEVLHVPGHTAGHIVLFEAQSGTLVTGDHVMGTAVPYTDSYYLDGPPDPRDRLGRRPRFKGLPAYMRSIRRLRRLPVETVLPAHGGVVRRGRRAIADAALFYEVRVQRIERGLRKLAAMGQEVTGWELWRALFPNADPVGEMRTRMLMVIGALDVLEESGACRTERREDGVLVHVHG